MKLILTEEQEFLRDTAKDFAQERTPVTHFRSLRDNKDENLWDKDCLLYTSPSPRDRQKSRMPSSA